MSTLSPPGLVGYKLAWCPETESHDPASCPLANVLYKPFIHLKGHLRRKPVVSVSSLDKDICSTRHQVPKVEVLRVSPQSQRTSLAATYLVHLFDLEDGHVVRSTGGGDGQLVLPLRLVAGQSELVEFGPERPEEVDVALRVGKRLGVLVVDL